MSPIDQIKKPLAVLIDIAEDVDAAKNAEGSLLVKVTSAINKGISQAGDFFALSGFSPAALVAQFKSLDDAGKAELLEYFKTKFDIAEDALEAKIEHGAAILVKIEGLGEEVLAFVKGSSAAAPSV